MKEEYIEELNGHKIGYYVNKEASGVDEDTETEDVEYWFKDGKLLNWSDDEVLDLSKLDDSWWDDAIEDEECNITSWYECFIESLIMEVTENELDGCRILGDHIENDYIWLVLLFDSDDNIIREIGELNPKDFL